MRSDCYYRARYYDSQIGAFTSEDPTKEGIARSLYSYVANGPLTHIDPTGLHRIYFDGRAVRVFDDSGFLVLKCAATSGKNGSLPIQTNESFKGPIPKGKYLIYPEEFSGGPGIKTWIRDAFGNWGTWRIPIHPVPGTETFGRGGFFFHGGVHAGSAGCVNLHKCDVAFHDLLANHAGPIPVEINYSNFQYTDEVSALP